MNTFKTYIPYFDQVIKNLQKGEIYLVKSNNSRLSYLFFMQIITSNLTYGSSVIYSMSDLPDTLVDDIKYLDFDPLSFIENQKLLIIQEPFNLDLILSNPANIEIVLSDFESYLDNYQPDFIFFSSILNFLTKNNLSHNKLIINRLLYFLKEKKITCFIDSSNLDKELFYLLEKFTYATFNFKYNLKNQTHQLNYKTHKTETSLDLIFNLDSYKTFSMPVNLQNQSTISDIQNVYYHEDCKIIVDILDKITNKKTAFYSFNDLQALFEKLNDDVNNIIILPTFSSQVNGAILAIKIRTSFKNVKILIVGSRNTPPNHKVRLTRFGIDKFISYPYNDDEIKAAILSLYPIKKKISDNYSLKLLLNNEILFKKEESQNIYFEAINRIFKEYAHEIIQNGDNLTFFKIILSDMNFYPYLQLLKQFTELVTVISNTISSNEIHLIAVFKNIKDSTKNLIINQTGSFLSNNNSSKYNNNNFLKTIFSPEEFKHHVNSFNEDSQKSISSICYPYEELNIDLIMNQVFEHVR